MKLNLKKIEKEAQKEFKDWGLEFTKDKDESTEYISYSNGTTLADKYDILIKFFFGDNGNSVGTAIFDKIEKTRENCKLVNDFNKNYNSIGTMFIREDGYLTLKMYSLIKSEKTCHSIIFGFLKSLTLDSVKEGLSVFDDLFIKE